MVTGEVRDRATRFGIRGEPRSNDLRRTKVTEPTCANTSVPELAVRMGWGLETAAKRAVIYAALADKIRNGPGPHKTSK